MNKDINYKLTELEVVLINEETPAYIEISYQKIDQSGFIYVLLSKPEYRFMSLSERIYGIFEILEQFCFDILNEFPVIVECLDETELTGMFRMYRK